MSEIQLAIQDQYMAAFLEFIKTLPYIEIQQVNRTPVVPKKDHAWHLPIWGICPIIALTKVATVILLGIFFVD